MAALQRPHILIVDLRSQLTMNIERTNRELGYRSAILRPDKAAEWLRAGNETDAIILSGGDFSVHQEGAPQPPEEIFTAFRKGGKVPILGICYGHQWLAWKLDGTVTAEHAEHGHTVIEQTSRRSRIFEGTPAEQAVWMNHGDSVIATPPGFKITACSKGSSIVSAMENVREGIFGVQFHPEATHTEYGKKILQNFLEFCGCKKDWQPSSLIDATRGVLDDTVGGGKLFLPFSGGVDSTVAAAIAAPVLGKRLEGATIDGGQFRLDEPFEIDLHAKAAGLNYRVIDMRKAVSLFAYTTDAEAKRKLVFQPHFYVFPLWKAIRESGSTYVMQGTLAPDLIESGVTGGDTIKTHHNVGIDLGVPELIPLCNLFKYEVRALARELGLPESVSERKPFPGPGLFIRVVGKPVTHELLDCVRWANQQVEAILRRDEKLWRDEISQLVVAYLGLDTVGQKGDGRVYRGIIGIRAVKTLDFMTAEGIEFAPEIQRDIKGVVTKHSLVVHAAFVPTDKPPGTTEFE